MASNTVPDDVVNLDENYTSYVMTNNTLAVDVIKLDEIEETYPSSAGNRHKYSNKK